MGRVLIGRVLLYFLAVSAAARRQKWSKKASQTVSVEKRKKRIARNGKRTSFSGTKTYWEHWNSLDSLFSTKKCESRDIIFCSLLQLLGSQFVQAKEKEDLIRNRVARLATTEGELRFLIEIRIARRIKSTSQFYQFWKVSGKSCLNFSKHE